MSKAIKPEQLPVIDTIDDKKYARYQGEDVILWCRLDKQDGSIVVKMAEEIFFDYDKDDWDGNAITPERGLQLFGHSEALNPCTGRVSKLVA
jgi:hypothetical protein